MNELDPEIISRIHCMLLMQNLPDVDLAELFVLENSVYPLDLISKCCLVDIKKWTRNVQASIIQSLPLDFTKFKEEAKVSVSSAMNLRATAIRATERYYRKIFSEIASKRWLSQMEFFHLFEVKLFEDFLVMDRISKRAAILRYLNLAQTLKVFNTQANFIHARITYQFLSCMLFDEFQEDSELLITLFQKLCVTNNLKALVLHDIRDDDVLNYILFQAQKMKFDFWGVWQNTGSLSEFYNPVAKMLSSRKLEYVKTLLDYGFFYSFDAETCKDRCDLLCLLRSKGEPIIDEYGLRRLQRMRPQHRMMMMVEIFFLFKNLIYPTFFKTLVLITRSIPDPFITPIELYQRMGRILLPSAMEDLARVCSVFKIVGVGDNEDGFSLEYKPRKLKHLSRCAVRQALRKNLQLPYGIDYLKIPNSLKDYLKLKH